MCHQTRLSLVQIMDCRLFAATALAEPMLTFYQLDPEQKNSGELFFYRNSNIRRLHRDNSFQPPKGGCIFFSDISSYCLTVSHWIHIWQTWMWFEGIKHFFSKAEFSYLRIPWTQLCDSYHWCLTRKNLVPWWRHQMETFSALLALCVGNSPVATKFPSQRPTCTICWCKI